MIYVINMMIIGAIALIAMFIIFNKTSDKGISRN